MARIGVDLARRPTLDEIVDGLRAVADGVPARTRPRGLHIAAVLLGAGAAAAGAWLLLHDRPSPPPLRPVAFAPPGDRVNGPSNGRSSGPANAPASPAANAPESPSANRRESASANRPSIDPINGPINGPARTAENPSANWPSADPAGALVAFGAGILSFVSPCVLPLVPGYVSMVSGLSAAGDRGVRRLAGWLSVAAAAVLVATLPNTLSSRESGIEPLGPADTSAFLSDAASSGSPTVVAAQWMAADLSLGEEGRAVR